jgi:hypothetical protein
MDPAQKGRVGYLVKLEGFGLDQSLSADPGPGIEVFTPFNSAAAPKYSKIALANHDMTSGDKTIAGPKTVKVLGAMESYTYGGGVGDAICISAYISSEAQALIKGKLALSLSTTKITCFEYWVINYDEENKVWYEEAFPLGDGSLTGMLNAPGGKDVRLHVGDEATKIHANVDVNVYSLYFEVVPAANKTHDLGFASSSKTPYAKAWGLKVGQNPATAIPLSRRRQPA